MRYEVVHLRLNDATFALARSAAIAACGTPVIGVWVQRLVEEAAANHAEMLVAEGLGMPRLPRKRRRRAVLVGDDPS